MQIAKSARTKIRKELTKDFYMLKADTHIDMYMYMYV